MVRRGGLETALDDLKQRVIEMSVDVNYAIQTALKCLYEQDIEGAEHVIDADELTNDKEEQILELGAITIATQQPVARDMREILIAFRIANDLERMGDLAVDIAKITKRIGKAQLIKPLVDFPKLGEMVLTMVNESIQAYKNQDVDLAYKMAKRDDGVDEINNTILSELFVLMNEKPETVNQGMLLCFASRHLERIADYATNIGEDIVYLVKGERPDLN